MSRPKKVKPKRLIEQLTPKQQKFVLAKAEGQTNAQAAITAGYNMVKTTADRMGQYVMESRRVATALSEVIDEAFPDVRKKAAKILDRMLTPDTRELPCSCPQCGHNFSVPVELPQVANKDQLKAIELLAKLYGWNAPAKQQTLVAKVNYTLPKDEE